MENSGNDITTKTEKKSSPKSKKKKGRRISEVVPIVSHFKNFNLKGKPEIENLLINNQESISYNNINILKSDLPNIVSNLNPIEKPNYTNVQSGKSIQEKKYYINSRNVDTFNNNTGHSGKFNTSLQLKRIIQNKNNKQINDADNNHMNLSQIVWHKSKNMGFVGSKNKNSRNIEISNTNINNSLSHGHNVKSFSTKNNNEKIKFTINKKNLMNTIKKPSKIKMEKKNLKYKIPINLINNIGNKKKLALNLQKDRKLNIKQRDINNNRSYSNISGIKNNQNKKNMFEYENDEKDAGESKSFIESTLAAYNGLVSQAQQIEQILIDKEEEINANKENELINNKLKSSIDVLNADNKIDRLDKKINDEQKTVEELQNINSDLNNKINLFKENSKQYETKVKELVNVINQLKQNNGYGSNNNSHVSNAENLLSGMANQNISWMDPGNKFIPTVENNNLILERKPKKKKIKFGFVESIFMKHDKFEIICKKKSNGNNSNKNDNAPNNKAHKEPKLVFVNMNKNNLNDNFKDKELTKEEYEDAASQMANHIIIESLVSIQNE